MAAGKPLQLVVLKMELHCAGCVRKVRKSLNSMSGVHLVVADAAANRVVVAGTADAAALKARIESRTKKPVQISGRGLVQAGSSKPQPPKEEDTGKKQPSTPTEEKKPTELQETTVLLKIHLHCDVCADRIRRWIYKIKGVKHVMLKASKDEVKVTGTMDVATMVPYLTEKLNRAVEAFAPVRKDKKKDKGTGSEMAGLPMASAAASMAHASVQARTHDVSPYGQVPHPPSYDAGGYYQEYLNPQAYHPYPPSYDAGGYYQEYLNPQTYQPYPPRYDAGGYCHEYLNPQAYQPYPPPYDFDTAPPPRMFSNENPYSYPVM